MNGYPPHAEIRLSVVGRTSQERLTSLYGSAKIAVTSMSGLRLAVRRLRLAQPAATTLPVVSDYWRCIPTASLTTSTPGLERPSVQPHRRAGRHGPGQASVGGG